MYNSDLKFRCQKVGYNTEILEYKDKCKLKRLMFANTIFANTKLKIETSLMFYAYKVYLNPSGKFLVDQPNTESKTISNLNRVFRILCKVKADKSFKKLGGVSKEVEVDESRFGPGERATGRNKGKGFWILGGVDREMDDVFAVVIRDRSKETLVKCIKDYVEPGTKIITDGWAGYSSLEVLGYPHDMVNHGYCFVDPITGVNTQRVERF